MSGVLELFAHESWLWTYAAVAGVEPTNNAGERAGRPAVLWRKVGGRSDGPRGSRFIERIMTVVRTCQEQGKDVLAYVESCCRAWRAGLPAAKLITDTKLKEITQHSDTNIIPFPVNAYPRSIRERSAFLASPSRRPERPLSQLLLSGE